jgi:hypothetical protein
MITVPTFTDVEGTCPVCKKAQHLTVPAESWGDYAVHECSICKTVLDVTATGDSGFVDLDEVRAATTALDDDDDQDLHDKYDRLRHVHIDGDDEVEFDDEGAEA